MKRFICFSIETKIYKVREYFGKEIYTRYILGCRSYNTIDQRSIMCSMMTKTNAPFSNRLALRIVWIRVHANEWLSARGRTRPARPPTLPVGCLSRS